MDDEMQWRSQMRKLNEPVAPTRDLWPGIAAAIARPAVAPRRRVGWRPAWALAASVLLVFGAGLATYRLRHGDHAAGHGSATVAASSSSVGADADLPTAFDWAVPADSRLAVAAQQLDKASADLQAALAARPDAVFLVGMLNRVNAQRMRLMRQSAISG